MKIALLGYGKMGKTIESLVGEQDEIVLKIGSSNLGELTTERLQKADVAIEFSTPDAAFNNIQLCLKAGVPVVIGTTAWLDRYNETKALCLEQKGALLYASNFSIGVNLLFALNKKLAQMMDHQPQYEITIDETHHTEKKDAPSGTAITLAEDILKAVDRKKSWQLNAIPASSDVISVRSHRVTNVPGTHNIQYVSNEDSLILTHAAHSRKGFASGALKAARWIIGKQGVFTMQDVLQL